MININVNKLLAEKEKRKGVDFLSDCLPQQKAFVEDKSHFKCLFGTRRMGKSFIIGLYLFMIATLFPGCTCLYLGLYRSTVHGIMNKDIFLVINRRFYKSKAKWNFTDGEWQFPNGPNPKKPYEGGSIIRLRGADSTEHAIHALVGQKYRLAILDEASKYRHDVRTLVYEVLLPAMGDEIGTIVLAGTPSNLTQGLFYDITSGIKVGGWKVHSWTWRENIYAVDNIKILHDEAIISEPGLIDTPGYKQEWLGEWQIDDKAIVYHFDPLKNLADKLPLPEKDYTWYLINDTGFRDESAFAYIGYSPHDPRLYITRIIHRSKLIPSARAKIIYYMWKGKWHPKLEDVDLPLDLKEELTSFKPPHVSRIIMDCGAQALGEAEDMRQRYNIPVEATDKQYKKGAIDQFNADLITGRIKVLPEAMDVISQWEKLIWDERKRKYNPPQYIEDSRIANDMADVCLYGNRMARNYLASPTPSAPLDPYGEEAITKRFFEMQAKMNKTPDTDDWLNNALSGIKLDGEDFQGEKTLDTSVDYQIQRLRGNRYG